MMEVDNRPLFHFIHGCSQMINSSLSLSLSLPPILHHHRVVLVQFLDNILKVGNITFLLPDATGLATQVKPTSGGHQMTRHSDMT